MMGGRETVPSPAGPSSESFSASSQPLTGPACLGYPLIQGMGQLALHSPPLESWQPPHAVTLTDIRSVRKSKSAICQFADEADEDEEDGEWLPPGSIIHDQGHARKKRSRKIPANANTPCDRCISGTGRGTWDGAEVQAVICNSPPKRRRFDARGSAPVITGGTTAAVAPEGDEDVRKLPPRSRLKGLIAWMKANTVEPTQRT